MSISYLPLPREQRDKAASHDAPLLPTRPHEAFFEDPRLHCPPPRDSLSEGKKKMTVRYRGYFAGGISYCGFRQKNHSTQRRMQATCGPDKASRPLRLTGTGIMLHCHRKRRSWCWETVDQAALCLMTPFPRSHPLRVQTSKVLQPCPYCSQGKVPRGPSHTPRPEVQVCLSPCPSLTHLGQFFLTQPC